MEVIDINFNDLEPMQINFSGDTAASASSPATISPSGGGFELLMNNQKRNSAMNMEYNLSDIDRLQDELNDLTNSSPPPLESNGTFSSLFENTSKSFSNFFSSGSAPASASASASVPASASAEPFLFGSNTTKTWDGFAKVSDIPDTAAHTHHPNAHSDREKRRKKRAMLKKLEEWHAKGMLSSQYSHLNMDSSYEEIEDEYETALDDKRKKDSIKLQGWWFMTAINSVEYMNAAFNPFDLNLDGWGEQVSEDIESYEEIFAELHEKYKGGKLSPELSLLLRIGFSAAVVNFSNKALSSATPGFNDVIRQSPELMREFTNATVKTMSQKSPGFAFAANLMNQPEKVNVSFGRPPAPVETQRRPDIAMARGAHISPPILNASAEEVNSASQHTLKRAEMRGPQTTDIDMMLSGLKTKPANNILVEDVDSTISISSLTEMQKGTDTPNRRRQKSSKQTNSGASISLDL